MSKRALIIGSDTDYCHVIKEFLELRDIVATIILNYKEGIEKLNDEKPDIAILEFTKDTLSPGLISNITNSEEFEVIDFRNGKFQHTTRNPVLILDDTSQINLLFDYIKLILSDTQEVPGTSQLTDDSGNLENIFIPNLIIDINQQKKTGVLSLISTNTLNVYFINGTPIFAEGGDLETALGRMLLDSGNINQESYEKAIEISSSTKNKIGEILVEMGVISPHDLNSVLEMQIKEKIIRSILYTKGTYSFKDSIDFSDRVVAYQITIHELIFEGIKRYVNPQVLEDKNPIVELSPKLKQHVNTIGLKPKELRFVQFLNHNTRIREILETTRLDKIESLKLIYFLSLFGIIKIPGISLGEIGQKSVSEYTKELDRNRAFGNEVRQELAQEEIIDLDNEIADIETKPTPDIENNDNEQAITADKSPEIPPGTEDNSRDTSEDISLDLNTEGKSTVIDTEPKEPEIEGGISLDIETERQGPQIDPDTPLLADEQDTLDSKDLPPVESDSTVISDTGISLDSTNKNTQEISIPLTDEKTSATVPEINNEIKSLDETAIDTDTEPEPGATDNPPTDSPDNKAAPAEEISIESDLDTDYNNTEENIEIHHDDEDSSSVSNGQKLSDEHIKPDNAGAGAEAADIDVTKLLSDDDAQSINRSDAEENKENNSNDQEVIYNIHNMHASLSGKNNYKILELSKDASINEIKTSYYSLVRYYHPDAHPNLDSDTKQMAEEIFSAITSAYEILSDVQKRDEYDSEGELSELKTQAKSLYEAEVTFSKGIKLLQQRNYEEAEKVIKEALDMNSEEPAYIGANAWAKFLAAEDKNMASAEARSALETAISINDQIPENYYYLGSVYIHAENTRQAEKCYKNAIKLDPDFIEAKRQLRLIQSRKQDKIKNTKEKKIDKRFWSSIFKK